MKQDTAKIVSMPREEYDHIERVNFSTLKFMDRSPAHYHAAMMAISRGPPSNEMVLGNCLHVGVFEPDRYRNSIAVWDGARRAGKDWEAFKAENEGKALLTVKAFALCNRLVDGVRRDSTALQYISRGASEQTVLWDYSVPESPIAPAATTPIKSRIDFVSHAKVICDLKSAIDGSPGGFGRAALRLNYHVQSALYQDGVLAATGERLPYVFVVIEKAEPLLVQVYRVQDKDLELGRKKFREWTVANDTVHRQCQR
jgi:hypothetical protein